MTLLIGVTQETIETTDTYDTKITTDVFKIIGESAYVQLIAFRDTIQVPKPKLILKQFTQSV